MRRLFQQSNPRNRLSALILFPSLLLTLRYADLATAQDTCPALVSDALAQVDSLCEETGRNQACYGNVTLIAEAQEDVNSLVFDTPGDIAKVADIQSLTLSPMDETASEWGVSLMKIQANLPDTLPGQNVTVVLFGDVAIKNAVGETSDTYTPMQAFYFRSGVGDAPCAEAPESGILIQTPEGAGKVEIVVNEVTIQLGSTAFLQAVPDDALYVNLLEGQATVTAFDESQTVSAGEMVSVPIDENLTASGPPNEPYVAEAIETLSSVIALLPEAVTPAESLSGGGIETVVDESGGCAVTAGGNINLRSGPGTVYARAGGLAVNESATPTGQVMGTDGYTWWQLANGNWVRSDVVNAAGNCDGLPVMSDIPPTPTPAPVVTGETGGGSGGATVVFSFTECERNGGQYNLGSIAGRTVQFYQGFHCCYASVEEAEAARAESHPIIVDGVPLSTWNGPVEPQCHAGNCGQGFNVFASWVATAGTHAAVPYNIGGPIPCTLIVEP